MAVWSQDFCVLSLQHGNLFSDVHLVLNYSSWMSSGSVLLVLGEDFHIHGISVLVPVILFSSGVCLDLAAKRLKLQKMSWKAFSPLSLFLEEFVKNLYFFKS